MNILAKVVFLLYFVLAIAVLHQKDDPACHKSKLPRSINMEDCCPTLPHFKDIEIFKSCVEHCNMWLTNPNEPGSKKCCMLNCTLILSEILDKNEIFNKNKMIELIKKDVKEENAKVWHPIVEKVVKNCYNSGIKYDSNVIMEMTPQCVTNVITLGLNITRCIRREMFFSCEDKQMTTENCQLLKAFGRDCLYWPWQCSKRVDMSKDQTYEEFQP